MSVHGTKKLPSFHELRGDFWNANGEGFFDACLLCSHSKLRPVISFKKRRNQN